MSKKILCIGENCFDRFIWCKASRLSPEVEVPVLVPESETQNNGMAGNVVENIKSLAPDFKVEFLRQQEKIEKVRYCSAETGHNFIRVDIEKPITPLTIGKFKFELKEHGFDLLDFDAVAISSYNKGFVTTELIEWVSTHHPLTFVDCKFIVGEWSKNVFVLKINEKEYKYNLDNWGGSLPEDCVKNLIVSRGKHGIHWVNKDILYGQKEVKVSSVSGAGDTVLACLVVSYLKHGDLAVAIKDANKAAAVAVSQRGVVAVKEHEVWETKNDGLNSVQ